VKNKKTQNGTKTPRTKVWKNNLWMLRRVWKHTPGYIIAMLVEGTLWGGASSIGVLYTKTLLDMIGENGDWKKAAALILGYAGYLVILYIVNYWYHRIYQQIVQEQLNARLHDELFRQAVRLDIDRYDDPEFYNDFVWAMDQCRKNATDLVENTYKLLIRVISSATLTGVLLSIDITCALVIFFLCALRILVSFAQNRMHLRYREEAQPLWRRDGYIRRVFQLPDYAKELRTSRISENLLEDYKESIDCQRKLERRYAGRWTVVNLLFNVLMHGGEVGMFILVLYKVMVTGEIGFGGFAVAMNAIWRLSWMVSDLSDRFSQYHKLGLFMEKAVRFMETEPNVKSGPRTAPPFSSLTVRNLDFAYGKGEKSARVLNGVNLEIHRGEKIAIVGYNGAGKTTLTKLIMRLYDPAAGEILYNGVDLREYDLDSLRARVAAVFQDFRIFAGTIAENVVGGAYTEEMEADVLTALEKSTFSEKLQTLPDGIRTHLTREFRQDGTQLSGGESQKIAIARAFYKNADLIILDEPSSALDPDAEYALNRSIASYAADKTVVFISHRLSTTRHADRIYMFDGGVLAEVGSHEELMARGGKYAYMFNLQAEQYRRGRSE